MLSNVPALCALAAACACPLQPLPVKYLKHPAAEKALFGHIAAGSGGKKGDAAGGCFNPIQTQAFTQLYVGHSCRRHHLVTPFCVYSAETLWHVCSLVCGVSSYLHKLHYLPACFSLVCVFAVRKVTRRTRTCWCARLRAAARRSAPNSPSSAFSELRPPARAQRPCT